MFHRWIIRCAALLLPALCVTGWLWSATHVGVIRLAFRDGYYLAGSTEWGGVALAWERPHKDVVGGFLWWGDSRPGHILPPPSPGETGYLGFSYRWDEAPSPPGGFRFTFRRCVGVPYWFLTLVSGVLAWLVWRKTKVKPAGGAFPVEATAKPN